MTEKCIYVKARLKNYEQFVKVYPDAKRWANPSDIDRLFPSADETIRPYLGKTIWLRKRRQDLIRIYYEIKDPYPWGVAPNWIAYFDKVDMVPPAKYYFPDGEMIDETWLEWYIDRWIIIKDLFIVTA